MTRRWRVLAAVLGCATLAVVVSSAVELSRFERVGARRRTLVYAAGEVLVPGTPVRRLGLEATLVRLGYTETRGAPTAPGQFRRTPEAWDIFLRDGAPGGARRVRLDLQDDRITRVSAAGDALESVTVEPELLTSAIEGAGEEYRAVRLADTPRGLIDAVLAAEDRRFFEHGALDVRALARAGWRNVRAGRVVQGGSTITQQLVKMRLLSAHRTLGRKLREAWLAELIEWRYSKDQILEAYVNEVYLGQRGPVQIHGVAAAARAYFGKELRQLSVGETAILAGMIRAPNIYSPAVNPVRARARRDVVLGRMKALGMLGPRDVERARREPVRARAAPVPDASAPYFIDHVRRELEQRLGPDAPRGDNVRIFTTLDPALQRFAESAVTRGIDRLETDAPRLRRRDPARRLEAALIAVDPATGEIKALVGGRDYRTSQYDRVAFARRQPGSAFKPFVFLAALRARQGGPLLTPASQVDDAPITLLVGARPWSPRNYEGRYEGRVSVRRALEESLNAATVRIAQTVGLPRVIEGARAVGFRGRMAPVPALALGAFEVTPIELAHAYLAFANGGLRPPPPFGIRAVYDADARVDSTRARPPTRVLSPAEAYLMTSLLQGVVASGTGSVARDLGVAGPVAGKTGTTNDGRDAWFIGYAPRLLALVWVGFDGGESHGLSGAQAALPIWSDFMRRALDARPQPDFVVPPGIVFADIDATNGRLARHACPLVVRETFLAGTEPPPCDEHGDIVDRVVSSWDRLLSWIRPRREEASP